MAFRDRAALPPRPRPSAAPRAGIASAPRRAGRGALLVGMIVLLAGPAFVAVPAGVPAASAASTARFVAVAPTRLADTRLAKCTCTKVDANTIRVQVAGRGGVPAGAVAAALTVTVASTTAAGYATVWPAGTTRQETSVLNWSGGETRANGTIVSLGAGGAVDVFVERSFANAQVIVDVTGVFVPASSATAGQFRPLDPDRVLDTRSGAPIAAGKTVRVPLPDGVPADATAVAINVTATAGAQGGYLTASAAGVARPPTSTVNTDGAGQTRAATAIVPVSGKGIDIYSSGTTHAIVDVFGWFTGASASSSSTGLFVPVAPTRLFDTRRAASPLAPSTPQRAYADDDAVATTLRQIVPGSSALVLNTTVTGGRGDGYLAAFPARRPQPPTSSLNWRSGETVANLAIAPTSSYGVAFSASVVADVLVDVTGYFTGRPIAIAAPDVPPAEIREPQAVALLDAGVTAEVMTTLMGADVRFLPDGEIPGNDSCVGHVGLASSSMVGIAKDVWQISYQRLSLARGLIDACTNPMQGPSAAAHEAAHLIIDRWHYEPTNAAAQQHRRDLMNSLPGDVECLAEGLAQAMFAIKGIGPFMVGYGGQFQPCAGSPSTQALARQILTITG